MAELRLLLIVEFVHQESAPLHSAFLRPVAPWASPRGQLDPHSRPLVGPGPLFISRTVFPARPAELWFGISRSGHSPFTDASPLPLPGTGVQGRPPGQIKCSAVSESGSPSWSGRFLFLHKAVPRAEMPSFGNGSQCTQPACLIQVHIHLKALWPVQKESSQNGNPRILARKPTSASPSPSYCPEFQQPLLSPWSPRPCLPLIPVIQSLRRSGRFHPKARLEPPPHAFHPKGPSLPSASPLAMLCFGCPAISSPRGRQ